MLEKRMVYSMGLGNDIIEVDRIRKAIENTKNFKENVFTIKEIEYCEKFKNKYEHYAGRYAAKEAYAKAIGTGFDGTVSFLDIEIENDEKGMPVINNDRSIKVSISHIKEYAIATVIVGKE